MWSEPDEFGVPGNMFGVVPEEFYGAVGRVVMVSAMVEKALADVLAALDGSAEHELAGKPVAEVRRRLDQISKRRNLPDQVATVCADAYELLDQRNAVVHSVWPSPTNEFARGWRGVLRSKRAQDGDHIVWTEHDQGSLRKLVLSLVRVHGELASSLHTGALFGDRV